MIVVILGTCLQQAFLNPVDELAGKPDGNEPLSKELEQVQEEEERDICAEEPDLELCQLRDELVTRLEEIDSLLLAADGVTGEFFSFFLF